MLGMLGMSGEDCISEAFPHRLWHAGWLL